MSYIRFPVPLITVPANVILDISSSSVLAVAHGGVQAEQNVYIYNVDVSGEIKVYTETDAIEVDASGHVVYKRVTIDGETGPFLNELDAQITIINNASYDLPADDQLVTDINALVNQIKCTRAEGMGTLGDYEALLKMATDISGSVNLSLDITTLTDFANAAETYGKIFENITQNLEGVTTIDNTTVLTNIKTQLTKIAAMYDALGALKLQISRTSTLQIPDSIVGTANKLQSVYEELDCTLDYIDYFCSGNAAANGKPDDADLNARDKAVVDAATGALSLFSSIIDDHGSVTAANNTQVKTLSDKVAQFSTLQSRMASAASCLNTRLGGLKNL